MEFKEILGALKAGKRVRKKHWPEGTYEQLIDGIVCFHSPKDTYNYHACITQKDLQDNDWEIWRH